MTLVITKRSKARNQLLSQLSHYLLPYLLPEACGKNHGCDSRDERRSRAACSSCPLDIGASDVVNADASFSASSRMRIRLRRKRVYGPAQIGSQYGIKMGISTQ